MADRTIDSRSKFIPAMMALCAIIAGFAIYNLMCGEPRLSLGDVWEALTGGTPADSDQGAFLVREVRLPRVVLSMICGLSLGLAGVLLQDSLRNPLADPGLLGISQGASFIMALSAMYPEVLMFDVPLPLLCLVVGTCSGIAVILLSGSMRDPSRVILAGTIVSALFATLTSALILLAPYERAGMGLAGYFRYVTGSVSGAQWSHVQMVLPWLAIGIVAALFSGRSLNLLQLGDETASGMGLNPFRARIILLVIAMVLVAPVIATVGPIAFLSLFAPHIARGWLRTSNSRQTLVLSALSSAALLLAADTAGRLLFFPLEIPAGIWTIVVVGPAAIAIVGRMRRKVAE